MLANLLAMVASTFQPMGENKLKKYEIQMLYMSDVSYNIEAIQFFNDDKHINNFMAIQKVFTSQWIKEEQKQPTHEDQPPQQDEYVYGYLQLNTNKIPRGVIELQRLFDRDVVQKNRPKEHINAKETDKVNLGSEQDLKYILLGKSCIGKLREDIIQAYREYINMIAQMYD